MVFFDFTHSKGDPAVQAYNPFDVSKLVGRIGGALPFAPSLLFRGSVSRNDQSIRMTRPSKALNIDPGLDTFYSTALARSEHRLYIREVISTLALIQGALPIREIVDLLGLPTHSVENILVELQAIIRLPDTDRRPVTFCHPSFCSFLTTESRSGPFYTPPTFHLYLFLRCFIILLKERRWKSSQLPEQPLAMAYSRQYNLFHWIKAECAFEKQTARSKIFELCSEAQGCQPSAESHAFFLDKLGIALLDMVKNQEVTFHIDWIASLHREALELRTFQDVEARAWTLNNLSLALCVLFEDTGSTPAIEEAISLFRETRRLCPPPLPPLNSHLPVSLNNLGNALYAQFQQSGCIHHILDAIEAHREALTLRSSPNLDRSFSLDNLGNALLARYEHDGAICHVEEAISFYREAVELQDMHRSSTLTNLGDALRCRAERFGRISDHDEAIDLHQRALTLLEGCPVIARRWPLMNVGIAFHSRFKTSGSVEDLMQAISYLAESLSLISSNHIYRQKVLRYLIVSLQLLYESDRSLVYLEAAIKHTRELLVQHYVVEHRHQGEWLDRLLCLLQMRDVATGSRDASNEIAKVRDELKK
jgi:tetratricopeptide (TPR) repeat protein